MLVSCSHFKIIGITYGLPYFIKKHWFITVASNNVNITYKSTAEIKFCCFSLRQHYKTVLQIAAITCKLQHDTS